MSQQASHAFFVRDFGCALFLFLGGIFMKCENKLCIYQEDGNCICDETGINEKELKKYKAFDLKKFESYFNKN